MGEMDFYIGRNGLGEFLSKVGKIRVTSSPENLYEHDRRNLFLFLLAF